MNQQLRSDWFLLKLQAEIVKLKDIPIFSCAETVEIIFNCPRREMKEIADEMNRRDIALPGREFNLGEYTSRVYDGVLILPIKNDAPVIVFKKFGAKLSQLRILIDPPVFDDPIPSVASYHIYWKGELWTNWPPVVKNYYAEEFLTDLMFGGLVKHPPGVIELPLKLFNGAFDLKIFGLQYITPVREALRKSEALNESRGKNKATIKTDSIIILRNKFIVSQFKKHKNIKRFPMKKTQSLWRDKLNFFFPNDPGKADKYDCTEMTIRRVLNKFIKENETRKELKELVKGVTPYDQDKARKEVEKDMQADRRFADYRKLKKANIKK